MVLSLNQKLVETGYLLVLVDKVFRRAVVVGKLRAKKSSVVNDQLFKSLRLKVVSLHGITPDENRPDLVIHSEMDDACMDFMVPVDMASQYLEVANIEGQRLNSSAHRGSTFFKNLVDQNVIGFHLNTFYNQNNRSNSRNTVGHNMESKLSSPTSLSDESRTGIFFTEGESQHLHHLSNQVSDLSKKVNHLEKRFEKKMDTLIREMQLLKQASLEQSSIRAPHEFTPRKGPSPGLDEDSFGGTPTSLRTSMGGRSIFGGNAGRQSSFGIGRQSLRLSGRFKSVDERMLRSYSTSVLDQSDRFSLQPNTSAKVESADEDLEWFLRYWRLEHRLGSFIPAGIFTMKDLDNFGAQGVSEGGLASVGLSRFERQRLVAGLRAWERAGKVLEAEVASRPVYEHAPMKWCELYLPSELPPGTYAYEVWARQADQLFLEYRQSSDERWVSISERSTSAIGGGKDKQPFTHCVFSATATFDAVRCRGANLVAGSNGGLLRLYDRRLEALERGCPGISTDLLIDLTRVELASAVYRDLQEGEFATIRMNKDIFLPPGMYMVELVPNEGWGAWGSKDLVDSSHNRLFVNGVHRPNCGLKLQYRNENELWEDAINVSQKSTISNEWWPFDNDGTAVLLQSFTIEYEFDGIRLQTHNFHHNIGNCSGVLKLYGIDQAQLSRTEFNLEKIGVQSVFDLLQITEDDLVTIRIEERCTEYLLEYIEKVRNFL